MQESKTTLDIATVIELIEEAAAAPVGSITSHSELPGLEGWDSMGMVMFAELVEDRSGVALQHEDFSDCATADALRRRISERAAG